MQYLVTVQFCNHVYVLFCRSYIQLKKSEFNSANSINYIQPEFEGKNLSYLLCNMHSYFGIKYLKLVVSLKQSDYCY